MPKLHTEPRESGNVYSATYIAQIKNLIALRRAKSITTRKESFAPDFTSVGDYESSVETLRAQFREILGFPLVETPLVPHQPDANQIFVASDDLGEIYRLQIEAFPGYEMYGLLFLPLANKKHSLVISQHRGMGTPELTADFFGSANYNDMTGHLLWRGYAVFAPQLFVWTKEFGPNKK